MSKDVRSGRPLVGAWGALQTNQAFQPLEAELDPPTQAVEGQNIICREVIRRK